MMGISVFLLLSGFALLLWSCCLFMDGLEALSLCLLVLGLFLILISIHFAYF